jgi:hypothetical protein
MPNTPEMNELTTIMMAISASDSGVMKGIGACTSIDYSLAGFPAVRYDAGNKTNAQRGET